MIIKIEPLDTLIFRDGKPFGNNEGDNWANSFTFPNPTTIYGVLRAIYFAQNPNDLEKVNKESDPTKNLKIKGIYLYKNDSKFLIFNSPKDIIKTKDKQDVTQLRISKNFNSSNSLDYILTSQKEVEKFVGFLDDITFEDYLNNKTINTYFELNEFVINEPKIGIGLNNKTKNVEDGKLYRVGLNRYKNLNIVVDFEGIDISGEGLLKLGGEAKGAYYQKLDDIELPKIEKIDSNIFKVILLTPAIFRNGWYPDFLDENFEGEFRGVKLKLIASVIGKAEYFGGWDIENNKPKPMYKTVPAGSVYYFSLQNIEDKNKVFNVFNYQSLVQIENYKKEGYGICIVGNIKEI